jgi:hypothetical protein
MSPQADGVDDEFEREMRRRLEVLKKNYAAGEDSSGTSAGPRAGRDAWVDARLRRAGRRV